LAVEFAGQPIGHIFKGQAVKNDDDLILENRKDRLSRNIGKQHTQAVQKPRRATASTC
jgi:hypothetical protein